MNDSSKAVYAANEHTEEIQGNANTRRAKKTRMKKTEEEEGE